MKYLTLLLTLLCSPVLGQWHEYVPPGSVDGKGILEETMSRCPEYMLRQIRNADQPTQCHEATHGIDSDISRTVGQDYGGFYVGNGKCYILPAPKVTIGTVAQYVPQEQRTVRYRTYLSGDRVKRNCLSILDEWTCYANDAQCTQELRLATDGGLKFAAEFSGFADVLVHAVQVHDPTYPGMVRLREFVEWQKRRVAELIESQQRKGEWLYGDLAELPTVWRERNRDGSCVHISTAHILHYMGLHNDAVVWRQQYRHGESPGPHTQKLNRSGLKYVVNQGADTADEFINWIVANRLLAGVADRRAHCRNFCGRVDRDGRSYAMILDNNPPLEPRSEEWNEWLQRWKRLGAWGFTIVSGEVPPPIPTGVVVLN